jgi:hypothetical protein
MVKHIRTGGAPLAPLGTTGGTVADIPAYGVTYITTAAETYTLAPPYVGAHKWIISTGVSSAARVIELSTLSSGDSILLGQTFTEIVIHTTDICCIQLLGVSTSKWMLLTATTGTAANVNTTGIVFQTS